MKQMRNFLRFHMLENTCVCEVDSRYSSLSAVSTVDASMLAGWAGSTDLHGETAPNILGTSTSHRYSETFTGCGVRNAGTRACLLTASTARHQGLEVSVRLHSPCRRFQSSPSPVRSSLSLITTASGDTTYMAFHCRRSGVSSGW